MKRLDLIFSDRELDAMLKALDEGGAPGYTVIKHVTGKGPQGAVSEDMEFTDLGANAHVIVFCDQKVLDKLVINIKPIINYYGGVGYISEANPI